MALQFRNVNLYAQVFYEIIQSDLIPTGWSKQRSIICIIEQRNRPGITWGTRFNCIGKALWGSRTGIIEDGERDVMTVLLQSSLLQEYDKF